MKFLSFLEEKIVFVIFMFSFTFFHVIFLALLNVDYIYILFVSLISFVFTFLYLVFVYRKSKKESDELIDLVDSLEEKSLISEVMNKPRSLSGIAYFYTLKSVCKDINDKLSKLDIDKKEYREYIESFVHEIKTPISALSLSVDNRNDYELREEIDKIDDLVEQMLFYVRSENAYKDYFVRKIILEDVVHTVLLKYKNNLLKNNVHIETVNLNLSIYSDEKWLQFIFSQIIQNSIKYMDKKDNNLVISAENDNNSVVVFFKDNGCGIKESDLPRVFDKGFTGNNRKKKYSTGIGLYLVKNLCDKLNLNISVLSKENEYTLVKIVVPKNDVYDDLT